MRRQYQAALAYANLDRLNRLENSIMSACYRYLVAPPSHESCCPSLSTQRISAVAPLPPILEDQEDADCFDEREATTANDSCVEIVPSRGCN
jgi:hypothetical protein